VDGTQERRPAVRTALLAGGMSAVALLLALSLHRSPLLTAPRPVPAPVLLFLLAAAFVLAELAILHVELRRETFSFHLSGVVLATGLLVATPGTLLVARLAGALVLVAVQHDRPMKASFNAAAYALEVCVACLLAQWALPGLTGMNLAAAAKLYLVVLAADLLTSSLVLRVIAWHGGPISRSDVAVAFVPAFVLSLASTVVALTAFQLASTGMLGWVLIGLTAPAAIVARLAYAALERRHQSLALVHEFVAHSRSAGSLDDPASPLMARILELLRASVVELVQVEDGAPRDRVLRVGAGGRVQHLVTERAAATQWLLARTIAEGEAVLVPRRTRDAALRRWLAASRLRDAILVPLLHEGHTIGVLTIGDRLGDVSTFTGHDLELAQTLAAHTAVAVSNATLMQQKLYEAKHDALTGLPNRSMVEAVLEGLKLRLRGEDRRAAVVLLDLNRFKEVNDALGHHAGDRLLTVVGRRVAETVPQSLVARLHGDEFAIVLDDVRDVTKAVKIAEDVAQALRSPVRLQEVVVSATASFGIAVSAPGGVDCGDLLRQADLAMYVAKEAPHGVVTYSPEFDCGHADRLSLVTDLQEAIACSQDAMPGGGLSVVYQPKTDLVDGIVRGVEALVRWQHPSLGHISPDKFVALAESTGLIGDLTGYVLSTALRQARAWHDQGLDVSVAVNLSARNLSDETLPRLVSEALDDAGLFPSALVLEITESSLIASREAVLPVLRALRNKGIKLSLDDFGTGYSSLSYLQSLPVQEVKIDRSFIQAMSADPGSQPDPERTHLLVRAIIDLASGLDLSVVAEGVEDADALRELDIMGCHVVQGFHLCRPGSPDDIETYLRAHGRGWAPDAAGHRRGEPARRDRAGRRTETHATLSAQVPGNRPERDILMGGTSTPHERAAPT